MSTTVANLTTRARPGKYLTFMLGDEVYGIEILKIREIIGMVPVTPVPRSPACIKGVINLRGKIIPVVDLRLKFEMASREYMRETCIVIVDITLGQGKLWIGAIVDCVKEVLDVGAAEIEDVPSFGTHVDTTFLLGMARAKSSVKLLLDIQKVLSHEELSAAQSAGKHLEAAISPVAAAADGEEAA